MLVEVGDGYIICRNTESDDLEEPFEVWILQSEDLDVATTLIYKGNLYLFESDHANLESAREYTLHEHSIK